MDGSMETLSDKGIKQEGFDKRENLFFWEKDVKDFIKKLKEELCYEMTDEKSGRGNMSGISQPNIWVTIDELAGDKII